MRYGDPSELPADQWPEEIIHEPGLKSRLLALPSSSQVWFGVRHQTGTRIDGHLMDAAIWVEANTSDIRAAQAAVTGFEPTVILDALFWAMMKPESPGKPCRPAKVLVDDEQLVANLGPYLAPLGVEIAYSTERTPIDKALKRLKFLNRDHVHPN